MNWLHVDRLLFSAVVGWGGVGCIRAIIYGYQVISLLTRTLVICEMFVMANLIGCSANCLYPMEWRSGKFNLRLGRRPRVRKEQSSFSFCLTSQ